MWPVPMSDRKKNENYELLKQCYWNILTKASGQRDIHHLALPLVGTGVRGYSLLEPYYTIPVALTPVTILSAIALFPHEYIHCRPLEKITIVCHSLQDYIRMKETYKWLFNVHLTSKYDRLHGAMLGGAIGDAFGYPVEFSNAQDSWIKEYILDPETNKALISDDTQMTLFTATGLLFGYTRSCLRVLALITGIILGYLIRTGIKHNIHKIPSKRIPIDIAAGLLRFLSSIIAAHQAQHACHPSSRALAVLIILSIIPKDAAALCVLPPFPYTAPPIVTGTKSIMPGHVHRQLH